MSNELLLIYWVEDNADHRLMFESAIKDANLPIRVTFFPTGEDALEAIASPDLLGPDAIFLDLDLPKMSGFEFLEKQSDQGLIPTIVITTSGGKSEIQRAWKYRLIGYVLKPECYHQLTQTITALVEYLRAIKLPSR